MAAADAKIDFANLHIASFLGVCAAGSGLADGTAGSLNTTGIFLSAIRFADCRSLLARSQYDNSIVNRRSWPIKSSVPNVTTDRCLSVTTREYSFDTSIVAIWKRDGSTSGQSRINSRAALTGSLSMGWPTVTLDKSTPMIIGSVMYSGAEPFGFNAIPRRSTR